MPKKALPCVPRAVLLPIIVIVLLLSANPSSAATAPVRLHLDAITLERGFTVQSSDQHLRVGVTPKALGKRRQASVRVKKLKESSFNFQGEKVLSNIYSFDIFNKKTIDVKKPIWISLQQTISTEEDSVVKYWSSESMVWVELPSTSNENEQRVQAAIHLPYAAIALFEKKRVAIEGKASWYDWHGAAMNDVPLGTEVIVTNPENGEETTTTVVSTGPFVSGRIIDLPRDIFAALAPIGRGVISVVVTPLL